MKPANSYPPYLQASNIGKATVGVRKETHGTKATTLNEYTEAEQNACSLNAMLNGGTCEACQ
jgi:ribonucleoside-diphosphate reductase alpha chain